MTENTLAKLFEHNNWANDQIIQACSGLSGEQLDAEPRSATKGSIGRTLEHLVDSQQHYLQLLTGIKPRFNLKGSRGFGDLREAARISGEALLELTRDERGKLPNTRLETDDGYMVEPWVLMVQVINHASEHREQISSMLNSVGLTPPDLDGWTYGEVTGALTPTSK